MGWHTVPRDDAWKRVTLDHVAGLGQRIWLRCNACGHDLTMEPDAFSTERHVPMTTPLLSIAHRLVCTRCGARKAHCWPEPYSTTKRT